MGTTAPHPGCLSPHSREVERERVVLGVGVGGSHGGLGSPAPSSGRHTQLWAQGKSWDFLLLHNETTGSYQEQGTGVSGLQELGLAEWSFVI